jgi:hypothetical protein
MFRERLEDRLFGQQKTLKADRMLGWKMKVELQ